MGRRALRPSLSARPHGLRPRVRQDDLPAKDGNVIPAEKDPRRHTTWEWMALLILSRPSNFKQILTIQFTAVTPSWLKYI